MGYRMAVAGATGNVGREILDVLHKRKFPVENVTALASDRSLGTEIPFGNRLLSAEVLDAFDFSDCDIALFAAGSKPAERYVPRAAAEGCVVIDNSSYFRYDDDIPLIVPEVNPNAIDHYRNRNIIANPNCSTAQMVLALKPLHERARIRRVVVSTYQSVSGSGKAAMDELFSQTRDIYTQQETTRPSVYPKPISFNVIPHIDSFMEDGSTREEWKMVAETKKIIDPSIELTATCVRVPVFIGHSESINIEFETYLHESEAREILDEAPGIVVVDRREPGGYATPKECAGEYATFVSRIRQDRTVRNGINLWCVSDNLLKGAALNAVQIAELLLSRVFSGAGGMHAYH